MLSHDLFENYGGLPFNVFSWIELTYRSTELPDIITESKPFSFQITAAAISLTVIFLIISHLTVQPIS